MDRSKDKASPEALFTEALLQSGSAISKGELRLLTAGLSMLRANENDPVRLNKIEMTAIESLMAYVAYKQGIPEKTVHSVLCATYGVQEMQQIDPENYPDVMDYLMNVTIQNAVN